MNDYFKYRFSNDIDFNINGGEFVSIIGNCNDLFLHSLLFGHKKANIFVDDLELNKKNIRTIRKKIGFVLYKHLDIFVGETVCDEIVFGLESLAYSKDDITELLESKAKEFKLDELLDKDPCSLGSSDKVKMKILSVLIVNPKIIVLDNIIDELDGKDKELVFNILNEFVKKDGIVINLTSNIEDTLNGNRIIILNDKKLISDGKVLDVLSNEKLLKRLGLGLPFIVELNKYLMDYEMIDKYYMSNERLVSALWK